jgi:hypothetical protein
MRADWIARAACKGISIEVFFPPQANHTSYAHAREICSLCPVRASCLDLAVRSRIKHGMFGGLTPHERARLGRRPRNEAA